MSDDPESPRDIFIGSSDQSSDEPMSNEITALTNNISRLQTALDGERDERREERFRWVVACAILIDIIAITAIDGSWLFLPVFMLQLIALIACAKAYGVDWAERLIGQLLYWASQWGQGKGS